CSGERILPDTLRKICIMGSDLQYSGLIQRRWTSPVDRATGRRACGPRRMPRRMAQAEPAGTRDPSVGISSGTPSNVGVVPHSHYAPLLTDPATPIGGDLPSDATVVYGSKCQSCHTSVDVCGRQRIWAFDALRRPNFA